MQFIYQCMVDCPSLKPLQGRLHVQHGYGDGNVVSDASSRGYYDVLDTLCRNMRVRHEWVEVPPEALAFVKALRERHREHVLRAAAERAQREQEPQLQDDPEVVDPFGDGVRIGEASTPGPGRFDEDTPQPKPRLTPSPAPRSGSPAQLLDFRSAPESPKRCEQPLAFLASGATTPAPAWRSTSPATRAASPVRSASPLGPWAGGFSAAGSSNRDWDVQPRPSVNPLAFARTIAASRFDSSPTYLAESLPQKRRAPTPTPKAAPVRHADRPISATAAAPALVAALREDRSEFALRPDDPDELERLVTRVASAVDSGVPDSTSRKDASYWRKWQQYCALYHTREVRDCETAEDSFFRLREMYFQAGFVLWYYDQMKPRRADREQADPQGAHKALQSVRRVHASRGITLCPAPLVGKALQGLLLDYVREHGPEALAPQRKEPLTNEHTERILGVENGTRLGKKHVVDWESDLFVCFATLLTALRHCGARKADHLPVRQSEFNMSHMRRSNLRWRLRGRDYFDPPRELLRDLQPGDEAIVIPAACKNDATGGTFGDKPMHLPFIPDDATNAAARYARLELQMPVPGEHRKTTPLYTVDGENSLDHATADYLFNKLAVIALSADVAATLSLHSGRVWLACALLERKQSVETIQAMCRWKSPESVKCYARLQSHEYVALLKMAMGANVDASLVRSLPTLDHDARFAKLQRALDQLAARVRRAASPSAPVASTAGAAPADSDESDGGEIAGANCDSDDDAPATCSAGPLLGDDLVVANQRVAVPFRVDGVETYCPGAISTVGDRIIVKFEDGCFQVNRNRLFSIAP